MCVQYFILSLSLPLRVGFFRVELGLSCQFQVQKILFDVFLEFTPLLLLSFLK